jgi:hypothetical protein
VKLIPNSGVGSVKVDAAAVSNTQVAPESSAVKVVAPPPLNTTVFPATIFMLGLILFLNKFTDLFDIIYPPYIFTTLRLRIVISSLHSVCE